MNKVMKIKVLYRKNLKMSEGKVASQVAHAVKNLGITPIDCTIVVLKVSDKKFFEKTETIASMPSIYRYTQVDKGYTEITEGTATALAYIEEH